MPLGQAAEQAARSVAGGWEEEKGPVETDWDPDPDLDWARATEWDRAEAARSGFELGHS
ncbi:MAG: hypothetical protein LZF60_80053 [Nitrospira sp.]|nr:MAG: hypothetical protein LZF60_80053 [Nitrospira sp.]